MNENSEPQAAPPKKEISPEHRKAIEEWRAQLKRAFVKGLNAEVQAEAAEAAKRSGHGD